MSQPQLVEIKSTSKSGPVTLAPELTLTETLRVLEVARGMRRERSLAEVALARVEIREIMRKRLMDAAAITGDRITEADVDAAIDQYFSTQHSYDDPPPSFTVFLAHLYVRRTQVFGILTALAVLVAIWMMSR
jgi:hypothetical protein